MSGILFLPALMIYALFCLAPCLWAALRLQKKVSREPGFNNYSVKGLLSSLIAMFLFVYLGPIVDGQADAAVLMFKHLFGLHTLLLVTVMIFSSVLRGATGDSGGFFFGVGMSSAAWVPLLAVQTILPIRLLH